MSLDCQQDPGVPGAAVLQQGSGGLSGALRGSVVEGSGWKHNTERGSTINEDEDEKGHMFPPGSLHAVSYQSETAAVVVVIQSVLQSVAGRHLSDGWSLTSEPLPLRQSP